MQNSVSRTSSTSVVQRVIDHLTTALAEKELRPGDRVPTEMELAEQLGIGRNSVREGIKFLTALGVLVVRRPEGTFVAQEFSGKLLDPLLYRLMMEQAGSEDSIEELRQGIETITIDTAARKATAEDVAALAQKLSLLKSAVKEGNEEKILQADDDFHVALSAATHNALFEKIAAFVRELTAKRRQQEIRGLLREKRGGELMRPYREIFERVDAPEP